MTITKFTCSIFPIDVMVTLQSHNLNPVLVSSRSS